MAGGTLSIRLTIAEAQQFRDDLQKIGAAGASALDPLKQSAAELSQRFGTLTESQNFAAKSAQANRAAQDESRAAIANLRGQLDPAVALLARYQTQMDTVNAAVGRQVLGQTEANALLTSAKGKYEEHVALLGRAGAGARGLSEGYGNAAYKAQQLSMQVNDVIASLGSGIPVTTMIMQQGGQVTQIYGGVGNTFRALYNFIGPVNLALGALSAGLAYFAITSESADRQVRGLQNSLRGTREDYVAMAAEVESAGRSASAATLGLSVADARVTATTIAKSRAFHGTADDLKGLVVLTASVAAGMGEDMPKAAELMATALQDPAKVAQQLADQGLTSMSQRLADAVRLLQASSDKAGASKIVIDALTAAYGGAHSNLTGYQLAVEHLKTTFTDTDEAGTSFGAVLMTIAEKAVSGVDALFQKMKEIRAWSGTNIWGIAPTGGDPATTAGGAVTPVGTGVTGVTASLMAAIAGALLGRNGIIANTVANTPGASPIYDVPMQAGQQVYKNPDSSAKGIFQLTDATAARGGVNASDYAENITGGVSRIMEAAAEWQGNLEKSAKAFHLGTKGLQDAIAAAGGNVTQADTDYWNKVQAANVSKLPAQVSADITTMATRANATPQQLDLALRIAVVESGGRQFVSKVAGAPAPAAAPAASNVPGAAGSRFFGPELTAQAANAIEATNLATKYANALGLIPDKAKEVEAKITAMGVAMKNLDPNSEEYKRDAETLAHLQIELSNTIGPQDKLVRSMADALAAGAGATPVMRELAATVQQVRNTARDANEPVSDLAMRLAISDKLAALKQGFDQATGAIDLHTKAVQATNAELDTGAVSLIAATNAQRALEDATASFLPGTKEFTDEIRDRTRAYNEGSAAAADYKTRQDVFAQRDTLDLIRAETAALGESEAEQKKTIDLLRAKQALIRSGADLASAASKETLAYVAAIDDASAALQRQRGYMAEFGSFMSSAFGNIQSAITQAFAQGTLKVIDFGNIARSVVSELAAELAKLALLNPFLNMLEGKDLPTFAGMVSRLFSSGGTGGSTDEILSAIKAGTYKGDSGSGSGSSGGGLLSDLGMLATAGKAINWITGGGLSSTIDAAVGYSASATTAALNSMGAGVYGPATPAAVEAAGAGFEGFTNFLTSAGESIATWATNLVGAGTTAATASSAVAAGAADAVAAATLGSVTAAETAANAAAAAAAASGTAASSAATATAAASETATIVGTSAADIAVYLPYIGAAITLGTELALGNYRGAAWVVGGAAVGTAILPGIGTAVGAAVGAAIDMFFPEPKKNTYMATAVDVADGQLSVGRSVAQNEDPTKAREAAQQWVDSITNMDRALQLTLVNANGTLGSIGNNIKDFQQTMNTGDLFARLRFTSTDTSTNLGRAESQLLPGQSFATPQDLGAFLMKIATFTDGLNDLGIQLASVAKDITDIHIAGVSGSTQFQTALNADLPRQAYADQAALQAEISKVYNFVEVTIPAMSSATGHAISSFLQGIVDINKAYAAAEAQAQSYGLSIDTLVAANDRLIAQQMAIAAEATHVNAQSYAARAATVAGDALGAALMNFEAAVPAQQEALKNLFLTYYGEAGLLSAEYARQALELDRTLASERLAILRQYNDAALAADAANVAAANSRDRDYNARIMTAQGDTSGAALYQSDTKGAAELAALASTYKAVYGETYSSMQTYADEVKKLSSVLAMERASIVAQQEFAVASQLAQKAVQLASQAQQDAETALAAGKADVSTAQSAESSARSAYVSAIQANVTATQTNTTALAAVASGLHSYIATLATGENSPLSPAEQLAAAKTQFVTDLVNAQGGNQTAAGALSGDASTMLTAGAAYYGKSSEQYAALFKETSQQLTGVEAYYITEAAIAQKALDVDKAILALAQDQNIDIVALNTAIKDAEAGNMAGLDALTKTVSASAADVAALATIRGVIAEAAHGNILSLDGLKQAYIDTGLGDIRKLDELIKSVTDAGNGTDAVIKLVQEELISSNALAKTAGDADIIVNKSLSDMVRDAQATAAETSKSFSGLIAAVTSGGSDTAGALREFSTRIGDMASAAADAGTSLSEMATAIGELESSSAEGLKQAAEAFAGAATTGAGTTSKAIDDARAALTKALGEDGAARTKDITDAMGEIAKAQATATGDTKAALDAAQKDLAKALGETGAAQAKDIADAMDELAKAQASAKTDAAKTLDEAQKALAKAIADTGAAQAKDITDAMAAIEKARATAEGEAAKALDAAQKALAKAQTETGAKQAKDIADAMKAVADAQDAATKAQPSVLSTAFDVLAKAQASAAGGTNNAIDAAQKAIVGSQGSAVASTIEAIGQLYGAFSTAQQAVINAQARADGLQAQADAAKAALAAATKAVPVAPVQTPAATTPAAPVVVAPIPPAATASSTAIATVTKDYQDMLGRSPDQAGLAYWVSALLNGKTNTDVRNSIAALPEYQVRLDYVTLLGHAPDKEGQDYWVDAITNKGWTNDMVIAAIKSGAQYKALHGAAGGGWIGNGEWGRDSVLASLAGGGGVALAGGEFVVTAPSAARYSSILPSINRGSYSNDNGASSAAVLDELRALRAELALLRQTNAAGHVAVVREVAAGNAIAASGETIAKLRASR